METRAGARVPRAASADPESLARARAAAAALAALARVARSLVLYDAGNATVRLQLSDYHAKISDALERHGDLDVSVLPFQLVVAGHVVLEDRDPEKSLPFKLHRDGVRAVRILRTATWEELLMLLQVVAVRYAAIRQQEEDAVTLLRRAELAHVQIDAVEGVAELAEIAEAEGEETLDLGRGIQRGPRAEPPPQWDTPLQKLPQPGPLEYRHVPIRQIPACDEGDEVDVATLSASLADDLLIEAARGGWTVPNRDLAAFVAEIRDALVVDGTIAPLRQLVEVLARAGATELRDEMLRVVADARTLELVLARVPEHAEELPAELVPCLPLLGVAPALDALPMAHAPARRRLLVRIVVARLPREVDLVLDRLPAIPADVIHDLVTAIVARAPDRAPQIVRRLAPHRSDAMRLEALGVLATVPVPDAVRHACELLGDASDAVRMRAVEVLGIRGDESVVEALRSVLSGGRPVPPELAAAVGRALATAAPTRAAPLLSGWFQPRARFVVRLSAKQRTEQWAAVAGIGMFASDEAEQMLRALAERADGELRLHCLATLARRQQRTEGP